MFETFVTVMGRVVSRPQRYTFPSGDQKTSFRLMAVERRFNRETKEWGDGDRLYVTVNCWRRLADNVVSSVIKGDNVLVSGRIYARQYTTEGGDRRESFEIDARAVGPDLAWCTVAVERPAQPPGEASTSGQVEEVIFQRAA